MSSLIFDDLLSLEIHRVFQQNRPEAVSGAIAGGVSSRLRGDIEAAGTFHCFTQYAWNPVRKIYGGLTTLVFLK